MAEAFEFAGNRNSIYYAIFWFVYYLRTIFINTNDTFSINKDCSNFVLKHSEHGCFEKDDLFYNPYGVWALIKK